MFNSIRISREIKSLQSSAKKIRDEYRQKIKNENDPNEIQRLASTSFFEESCVEEEINVLITQTLIDKAKLIFIPLPNINDKKYWKKCEHIYPNRNVLNNAGISEVRSLIRKEKIDRNKLFFSWTSYLIALIGALIGLFTIILE
ncbi:MAG: hypothetical protein H8E71_03035 [Candidatus Marinimicrobia bacterium]|nr:hypothetical protein [Candidatus Neomarinimicrobiota bacterium]